MTSLNLTGSGVVIYFDNRKNLIKEKPPEIIYLVLIDNNDKYDFTKGVIDYLEDSLDCAIRETKEESNLEVDKNFVIEDYTKIFGNGLKMYIGKYILDSNDLNKNIKIYKNKETGILEHKGYLWDSFDNIKNNFPDYLLEVLEWSKNKIEN
jgi:8-oxo-dGTP pyrophosphatase MutT (NUDIX family)